MSKREGLGSETVWSMLEIRVNLVPTFLPEKTALYRMRCDTLKPEETGHAYKHV